MTAQYTAAIVGCGDIAHHHMAGYRLNEEVEVVAVVDPVAAAREQFAREYGVGRTFASVEALFEARPEGDHRLKPGQIVSVTLP